MPRFVSFALLATSAALVCAVPIGCGSSSPSDVTPAPNTDADVAEGGAAPDVGADATAPTLTLTLTLDATETEIVAGATATLTSHVTRGPSSNGPITLTLVGLPSGVTAAPVTIADGQTDGTVTLSAAQGATQGLAKISAAAALGAVTASAATSLFVRGAPGTLDTSFAASGVMFNPQPGVVELRAVAVQSDGKILVGGELYAAPSTNALVTRIDEAGKLDPTFGTGGSASTAFATGGAESFFSLAIAPGGSIVAGGYTFTGSANDRVIAARMGADGKPDLSFNATGRYITSFPGTQGARSVGMILQKDGKLTLLGQVPAGPGTWGVARVTAQGGTDAMFGGGGAVLPGATSGTLWCGGEQSDGNLVVAGGLYESGTLRWGITRLIAATGAIDSGYGVFGFAKLSFPSVPSGIIACRIDPADKLVSAGYLVEAGIGKIAVGRFGKDGTFDPTFHAGQPVSVPLGAGSAYPTGLFLQKDGKIVVAGNSPAGILTVLRLGADGTLDPGFGSGGALTTSGGLSGLANLTYSGFDESRRRVVLAGNANLGAAGGWFVSRVWL